MFGLESVLFQSVYPRALPLKGEWSKFICTQTDVGLGPCLGAQTCTHMGLARRDCTHWQWPHGTGCGLVSQPKVPGLHCDWQLHVMFSAWMATLCWPKKGILEVSEDVLSPMHTLSCPACCWGSALSFILHTSTLEFTGWNSIVALQGLICNF